jgi:hypothetical protein
MIWQRIPNPKPAIINLPSRVVKSSTCNASKLRAWVWVDVYGVGGFGLDVLGFLFRVFRATAFDDSWIGSLTAFGVGFSREVGKISPIAVLTGSGGKRPVDQ